MQKEKKRFIDSGLMLTPQRLARESQAGHWQNLTADDFLGNALSAAPDKIFIVDYNSVTKQERLISYRQIDRISKRIAARLHRLGVGRGDVVAIQLPNWWEFVAIHLACVRIGAITNPLQPIFRERELEFMLGFAETKCLFIPDEFRSFEYAPMIEEIRAKLPDLNHVFTVGGA